MVEVREGGFWTFDSVEERLVEAMGFLDRMPQRFGRRTMAGDGPWGQIVLDRLVDWVDMDAVADAAARDRSALTTAEVGRMEEALEWVAAHVPARGELRRIVGAVVAYLAREGGRADWIEIKRRGRFRSSPDALRMSYSRAIGWVAARLNGCRGL